MQLFLNPWFLFFLTAVVFLLQAPFGVRIKAARLREDKRVILQFTLAFWGRLPVLRMKRTFQTSAARKEKSAALVRMAWKALRERGAPVSWAPENRELAERLLYLGRGFLKGLQWRRFDLNLSAGTGDAAHTAVLTGFIRALFSFAVRYFFRQFGFQPRLTAIPSYYRREAVFSLDVELRLNAAQVMLFLLQVSLIILKWRLKKNERTSDPGLDGDGHGKLERDGGCQQDRRRCH